MFQDIIEINKFKIIDSINNISGKDISSKYLSNFLAFQLYFVLDSSIILQRNKIFMLHELNLLLFLL